MTNDYLKRYNDRYRTGRDPDGCYNLLTKYRPHPKYGTVYKGCSDGTENIAR